MNFNLSSIVADASRAARKAGDEVMRYYAMDDVGLVAKSDGSPVTLADKASEAILLPILQQLTPSIPIVSEESFSDGHRPDTSAGTFWVVDPIDGTKQFVNKTGGFVVAMGLIVDFYPALGVVFHPALDILFTSTGPGTAMKTIKKEAPTPMRCRVQPETGAHLLTNGSYADIPAVKKWLADSGQKIAHWETASPTFHYSRVAEGSIDILAGLHAVHPGGGIHWWDIAPGQALIEGAGGSVRDLGNRRIRYDNRNFMAPAHIARGLT